MVTSIAPPVLEPPIGTGGFGTVYLHAEQLGTVVKRFREPKAGDDLDQLLGLIDTFRFLRPSEQSFVRTRFSWPIEAFGNDGSIDGYLMPQAPSDSYFELVAAGRSSRPLLQAKFLLDGQYFRSPTISSAPPRVSQTNRMELAIDLLRSVEFLHRRSLIYGDVSSNNVCVQLGETARVFLLDADSIRSSVDDGTPLPVTPDWEVDESLGLVETDRAKCALFIWRLLTQYPTLNPSVGDIPFIDGRAGVPLGRPLLELWRTGSLTLVREVDSLLRDAMGRAAVSRALRRDLEEGFARSGLFWDSETLFPEDHELLRRARSFCAAEALAEESAGFERRRLLRQLSSHAEFRPDLRPDDEIDRIPSTDEELEKFVLETNFLDIARSLGSSSLGDLERHGWVERATRHALLREVSIEPQVTVSLDRVKVSWSWPDEPWVSAAQLEVTVGRRWNAEVIERPADNSPITRDIATPPSSDVVLRVFPAVLSRSGTLVTSPSPAVASYRSADEMVMSDLRSARRFDATALTDAGEFEIQIIDPEREREELARQRRRRRQERALQSVGALIAIAALVVPAWWWLHRDTSNPRLRDRSDGRHLSWRLTDDTPSEGLISFTIEKSFNEGLTWEAIQSVSPEYNGIRLLYRLGDEAALVRVVADYDIEHRVVGAPSVELSEVQRPSQVRDLEFSRTAEGYEFRWTTPEYAGGSQIGRYDLQVGEVQADGSIVWGKVVPLSSNGETDEHRVHRYLTTNTNYVFRLRAVALSRAAGEWSETLDN